MSTLMAVIVGYAIVSGIACTFVLACGMARARQKGRSLDDAWERGQSNDMKLMRDCWNQRALQARATRSVSNTKGEC